LFSEDRDSCWAGNKDKEEREEQEEACEFTNFYMLLVVKFDVSFNFFV
jgi:hypothetical protein